MNTNTHHCAGCRHDGDPLTEAQKAMVRLISFTLRPARLTELSALMDEHDPMVVAAFALYCEPVDFAGASLIEQFDRAYINTFENWDACGRFIAEFVYRRGRWITTREQKTGRSFADLLAIGDETVQRHLRGHGLQVIDLSDTIAVFHRRSQ
ncbi:MULTISPECIES: hypothetical protein [unclassified Microbacterium]|uniref:hypothetical protein n=1 Tax=unclassified Microbacterium TaxID=2609290 RepID=UPI00364ACA08